VTEMVRNCAQHADEIKRREDFEGRYAVHCVKIDEKLEDITDSQTVIQRGLESLTVIVERMSRLMFSEEEAGALETIRSHTRELAEIQKKLEIVDDFRSWKMTVTRLWAIVSAVAVACVAAIEIYLRYTKT
jgi:hypothetical protein